MIELGRCHCEFESKKRLNGRANDGQDGAFAHSFYPFQNLQWNESSSLETQQMSQFSPMITGSANHEIQQALALVA